MIDKLPVLALSAFVAFTGAVVTPAVGQTQSGSPGTGPAFDFQLPTDGLVADLGVGLSLHPKQVGTSHSVGDLVPAVEVQWGKDAHFSLVDGATWTPIHLGPVLLGPVVEFRQDFASPRLARGLRNADSWEAGGLARILTPVGEFEGRLRRSLDGDDTQSADISFDTAVQYTPRMAFAFEVRGSWSNEAFAIPGRKTRKIPNPAPIASATDYYSAGAQVAGVYQLGDGWMVTGIVSKDEIVAAEKRTLKFSTRSVPIVSVVITRRFRIF